MIVNVLKKITSPKNTKMVLIVRSDLNMARGKIAAQCAHAAVSLCIMGFTSFRVPVIRWLFSGQPKIVLKVDTDCENTLKKLYCSAKKQNLNTYLVLDAGKTQLTKGTLTVLGIGPSNLENIYAITKSFKLL